MISPFHTYICLSFHPIRRQSFLVIDYIKTVLILGIFKGGHFNLISNENITLPNIAQAPKTYVQTDGLENHVKFYNQKFCLSKPMLFDGFHSYWPDGTVRYRSKV